MGLHGLTRPRPYADGGRNDRLRSVQRATFSAWVQFKPSLLSLTVVGYSWIDANLPLTGVNSGWGVEVAWKRALLGEGRLLPPSSPSLTDVPFL